jgi:hypothetical protein
MKTHRLQLVSAGVVLVLAAAGIAYAHVVEQKARLRGDRVAPDEGDPNGTGRGMQAGR